MFFLFCCRLHVVAPQRQSDQRGLVLSEKPRVIRLASFLCFFLLLSFRSFVLFSLFLIFSVSVLHSCSLALSIPMLCVRPGMLPAQGRLLPLRSACISLRTMRYDLKLCRQRKRREKQLVVTNLGNRICSLHGSCGLRCLRSQ